MATDSKQREIYTISGNADDTPPNQDSNKGKEDEDDSFSMGCYQQMRKQFGLRNDGLSHAGTILFILAPSLLMPYLMASSPPRLVLIPPLAWVAGYLSELVGLTPTPSMLVVGMVFRGIGWFNPDHNWKMFIYISRYVAVATVLTKGGLALTHLPNMFLALIPCTAEAISLAVLSYFFLDFPWLWGIAYGYAVSTASSSINAGKLAQLKAEGYGPKEIYSLIFPASTVENIYSISGFAVSVAMIFSNGDSYGVYIQRFPVALSCGIFFALIWGSIVAVFPHKENNNVVALRSTLLALGSCCVYLGAKVFDLSAGGPLGTMATAVIASYFWRGQGWSETKNPVFDVFTVLWNLMEPVLFGYVGAEVDVFATSMKDFLLSIEFLVASVMVRLICFIFCVALRKEFEWKEIALVTLIWLPKATVLAALCPQVLDMTRKVFGEDTEETSDYFRRSKFIILSSVVGMLITSPVSNLLVNHFGPKMLKKPKAEGNAESKGLIKM